MHLLFPRFVCLGARFKTTKAGVYFRNFSTEKNFFFSETRESEKILEEREKITFIRKDVMPNVSARKIILCEFFCLHFKRNNDINIKREWFLARQIFMERHSKGEFLVLTEELKIFDNEFFFKRIAAWHFDFSHRCFTVFVAFFNWLYLAISLNDYTIEYFFPLWSWIVSTQKRTKNFEYIFSVS